MRAAASLCEAFQRVGRFRLERTDRDSKWVGEPVWWAPFVDVRVEFVSGRALDVDQLWMTLEVLTFEARQLIRYPPKFRGEEGRWKLKS
jgi:hypothetical protein